MNKIVSENQGLKGIEFLVKLSSYCFENGATESEKNACTDVDIFFQVLEQLEKDGKIVIVRYVLKNSDYKERMFILPAGTQILTR
jgi:hypothetical protein